MYNACFNVILIMEVERWNQCGFSDHMCVYCVWGPLGSLRSADCIYIYVHSVYRPKLCRSSSEKKNSPRWNC